MLSSLSTCLTKGSMSPISIRLMLRPTRSTVIWMQQFGRGLRRAPGKPCLKVIDYIGNHRSFLMKLRSVAALAGRNANSIGALRSLLDEVRRKNSISRGLLVTYELESIEILEGLLKPGRQKRTGSVL